MSRDARQPEDDGLHTAFVRSVGEEPNPRKLTTREKIRTFGEKCERVAQALMQVRYGMPGGMNILRARLTAAFHPVPPGYKDLCADLKFDPSATTALNIEKIAFMAFVLKEEEASSQMHHYLRVRQVWPERLFEGCDLRQRARVLLSQPPPSRSRGR